MLTPHASRTQVPYENYRKVFRTSQKYIEKELGSVQSSASELAKRAQATNGETPPEESVKAIDAMMNRIETLKRKVRLCTTPLLCATYSQSAVVGFARDIRCPSISGRARAFPTPRYSGGAAERNRSRVLQMGGYEA